MAVKYGKFEMPSKIVVDEDTATPKFARFIAEPLKEDSVTPSATPCAVSCSPPSKHRPSSPSAWKAYRTNTCPSKG